MKPGTAAVPRDLSTLAQRFRVLILMATLALAGCQGALSPGKNAASRSTASSRPVSQKPGSPSSETILRINGQPLDPADITKDLHEELATRQRELPSDQYRAFVDQRAAQWLTDRITESLLYQKASLRLGEGMEKNIDRYVDAEIRRVVTREHGGVQHRFEKHLEAQGQSLDYYRDRVRHEAVIAGFLEGEVKSAISEPSRTELMAAYDAHAASRSKESRRSMSLIEIRASECVSGDSTAPSPEQLTAARAEARRRILAAQSALASGRPFADVARQYSHDFRAAEGGQWGFVSRGSVRPRYEPAIEALYHLDSGQTSAIIEGPESFFIVRCDQAESSAQPAFADVQSEMRERYFRNEYNQAVGRLIDDLRKTARLEPSDLSTIHQAAVDKALTAH